MALQKCGLNISNNFKELLPHGTLEFPCAGYQETYSNNNIIPWHRHNELEIIYVKFGNIKIKIPSNEFNLCEGNLIIFNQDVLHYAEFDSTCEIQSLVFSPILISNNEQSAIFTKILDPLLQNKSFSFCIIDDHHLLKAYQETFEHLKNDTFGYEIMIRNLLSSIILYISYKLQVHSNEKKPLSNDDVRIKQMLEYIHSNFDQPIKLKDIYNQTDISERECLRCFNRCIGESPIHYLNKYRLMKAAELLVNDNTLTISQIASKCGYDSSSFFSKSFKQYYKCTPLQYKKSNKK